MFKRWET